MMRNIRVVFAVLSLSVVLVAGVADELQAQEKRQGWIKRLRYRRELRRELQGEIQLSGDFALYPMAVKWAEISILTLGWILRNSSAHFTAIG